MAMRLRYMIVRDGVAEEVASHFEIDKSWPAYRVFLFGENRVTGGHSLRLTQAGTTQHPVLVLHWDF